jgi:hypothetical protein
MWARCTPSMKLVLSRKGFDSAHGGCPSPILDGDLLCSLPIPDDRAPTPYRKISFNGSSIGQTVEDLTRGRVGRGDRAHLDPDLRRDAIARAAGWRPIFGQAGAAQSHLARQGVGPGDLFLFFGCFRRAERVRGALRFVTAAPKLHVVYGWMRVASVIEACDGLAAELPWAQGHPHLATPARFSNNTLYIAREGGTFDRLESRLILTQTHPYVGCSKWRLPRWFEPAGRTPLSYHSRAARWTDDGASVRLQSAYPGQEFVLDLDQYPEAHAWVRSIFRAGNQRRPGCAPHTAQAASASAGTRSFIPAKSGSSACPSTNRA